MKVGYPAIHRYRKTCVSSGGGFQDSQKETTGRIFQVAQDLGDSSGRATDHPLSIVKLFDLWKFSDPADALGMVRSLPPEFRRSRRTDDARLQVRVLLHIAEGSKSAPTVIFVTTDSSRNFEKARQHQNAPTQVQDVKQEAFQSACFPKLTGCH